MNDEATAGSATISNPQLGSALRHEQSKRRSVVTEAISASLDKVIFVQIGALYLLDCSFTQLLFRTAVQAFLLTPRPKALSSPPPVRIIPILTANVFAFLGHVLGSPDVAGEATRFYLHGSVLIDFVGVKGPSIWRIWLVLLDILILLLQLMMLAASMENQKLQKKPSSASSSDQPLPTQDLDSEERGIRTQDPLNTDEISEGIELQPLRNRDEGDQEIEREQLLAEETGMGISENNQAAQPVSGLDAGEVIVDLHIWETCQTQFRMWQDGANAAASSSTSETSSTTVPRFRIRVGNRTL